MKFYHFQCYHFLKLFLVIIHGNLFVMWEPPSLWDLSPILICSVPNAHSIHLLFFTSNMKGFTTTSFFCATITERAPINIFNGSIKSPQAFNVVAFRKTVDPNCVALVKFTPDEEGNIKNFPTDENANGVGFQCKIFAEKERN